MKEEKDGAPLPSASPSERYPLVTLAHWQTFQEEQYPPTLEPEAFRLYLLSDATGSGTMDTEAEAGVNLPEHPPVFRRHNAQPYVLLDLAQALFWQHQFFPTMQQQ